MDRKQAAEALIFAFVIVIVIVVVLWSLRPRRPDRRGGSDASYSYGTSDGSLAEGGSGHGGCASGTGGDAGGCGGGGGGD
ncbi:hypothetical protein [Methylobacterium sp. J-090]|uniref:hypothetical protein n=1 Tax=Methylobacterium sp. J-090 TaxID=2836666 RepID=UPI001FB97C5E|nr:hypothetical protein [Methylobacterium sp. J-090]MCJ2081030.1 hypothetical protein [Methylobacterium sp. J-090]